MMKRPWLILHAAAAGIVFSMPVWASAPITGDAAQYRPFESSAPFIFDRKTQLQWQRGRSDKQVTFANAKCTEGRLPSLKELLTIFDEEPAARYNGTAYENRFIDQQAFGLVQGDSTRDRTPAGAFWTSSFVDEDQENVWTVDFKTGNVQSLPVGSMAWTRCVDTF
ncbi:MAG: DUF1566 domain-containing protein [Labilithrix sp.]